MGEIAGGLGGKGEEFHDQHAGKVWRFEEDDRNRGTGTGSSEEKIGSEDIEKYRIGALTRRRIAG